MQKAPVLGQVLESSGAGAGAGSRVLVGGGRVLVGGGLVLLGGGRVLVGGGGGAAYQTGYERQFNFAVQNWDGSTIGHEAPAFAIIALLVPRQASNGLWQEHPSLE